MADLKDLGPPNKKNIAIESPGFFVIDRLSDPEATGLPDQPAAIDKTGRMIGGKVDPFYGLSLWEQVTSKDRDSKGRRGESEGVEGLREQDPRPHEPESTQAQEV